MKQHHEIPGSRGGQHAFAKFIDYSEGYGSHVIQSMISKVPHPKSVIDIGAGTGRDLQYAKKIHPSARTIAIEACQEYAASLVGRVDEVHIVDIERGKLPFPEKSIDIIIANQVLEHTKEVFWIFHEITRVLAPGGYLIFGVPNVLSLHNRILGLFGGHPTQHKLYSGHVRPFSKSDTL